MLSAGELNRRVTVQRKTTAKNGLGEAVETFADLVTVWAKKRDVTDIERLRAAETGAELTTRFIIRHSPETADVDARDQLIFEGMTFNITGVRHLDLEDGYRLNEAIEINGVARPDLPKV